MSTITEARGAAADAATALPQALPPQALPQQAPGAGMIDLTNSTSLEQTFSPDEQAKREFAKFRSTDASPKKAKKSGGLLGFLTLKEPSTSAWAELAAAQKEQAKLNGGKPGLVSGSRVSLQKLPDHVPKVNTKWDGLPEGAKRGSPELRSAESRNTNSRGSDKHKRTSNLSTATAQSNWSAIMAAGNDSRDTVKAARHGRRQGSQSRTGPNHRPGAGRTDSGGNSSTSSSIRSPIVANHPAYRPKAVEETDENRPEVLFDWETLSAETNAFAAGKRLTPRYELGVPGPTQVPELDATSSSTAELPANSPSTPTELDSRVATTLLVSEGVDTDVRAPESDGDLAKETQMHDEDELRGVLPMETLLQYGENQASNEIARRSTPEAGKPRQSTESRMPEAEIAPEVPARSPRRAPINFSRPRIKQSSPDAAPRPIITQQSNTTENRMSDIALSPTLKGRNGLIEPFLTDTVAAQSRATGQIPNHDKRLSDARLAKADVEQAADSAQTQPSDSQLQRSNSTSSQTPSVALSTLSQQWHLSSKERLGLGGKMKKRGEVVPWEFHEGADQGTEEGEQLPRKSSKRRSKTFSVGSWKGLAG